MPHAPTTIAIEDLPFLADEAALFCAAIDPADMQAASDHIIISLITNP